MAIPLEGEALVNHLRDRLAKMDEAMAIMQGLREEPMVDEGAGLDKIIELLQIIHEWTADAIESETSGEDEGVA